MFLFVIFLEHRVRETDLHTDTINSQELAVPIVHITRPPTQNIRIQRHKQSFEARLLARDRMLRVMSLC
jgi:hypothetical protein